MGFMEYFEEKERAINAHNRMKQLQKEYAEELERGD